ncbi:hypothetical protein WN66_06354 [Saccharomyces cerevisiae]|nr:hypothetical protein WN66_06354 [Saccharomyces cerevisiae]
MKNPESSGVSSSPQIQRVSPSSSSTSPSPPSIGTSSCFKLSSCTLPIAAVVVAVDVVDIMSVDPLAMTSAFSISSLPTTGPLGTIAVDSITLLYTPICLCYLLVRLRKVNFEGNKLLMVSVVNFVPL